MRALKIHLTVLLCLLCVTGCGSTPVADDLSQREANQIIAVLREKGIEGSTEKERGGRGRYSVAVAGSDFGRAAALLSELGLPEEREATFSELVAQSGFLPSSREVEALRLDRALASELEALLLGHPGVSSAHVVIRYHSLSAGGVPSISVVAQRKTASSLETPTVREMIARAIPTVRMEDIVVTLANSPINRGEEVAKEHVEGAQSLVPFLVFWRVPDGEYNSLAGVLIALLIFVAGLAGLTGYIFGQYTVSRQQVRPKSDGRPVGAVQPSESSGPTSSDNWEDRE